MKLIFFKTKSCQEEAWNKYHKILCHVDPNHPLKVVDELWRSIHFPPETSSISLVLRILASIVLAEDPEQQIGQFMNLMHDTVNHKERLVHKMLGEQFADQLEQLRMATLTIFAAYPAVQSLLSPDGFAAILALIGRNSQGTVNNFEPLFSYYFKNYHDVYFYHIILVDYDVIKIILILLNIL